MLYFFFNQGTIWGEGGGQRHALAALPPGKNRYQLYRKLGGPQDRCGKSCPRREFDTRTVQSVASRYTHSAIPAHANTRTRPKMINTELANYRCRVQPNIITAVMRMKNLPNKKSGHFGVPKKCARDKVPFFKKVQSRGEKNGTNGVPQLWSTTPCNSIEIHLPMQIITFLSNCTASCYVTR